MIITKAYDVEILPNFFSIAIVDVTSYLKEFKDACIIEIKKGKENKIPIPLVQKYTVEEIKKKLKNVKREVYRITDTDDSQLLTMYAAIMNMKTHIDPTTGKTIVTHMFGFNNNNYDKLMVAAFLMCFNNYDTKDMITRLYETSQKIIELQDDKDASKTDYFLDTLRKFQMPYVDVDVMTIFALNKVGKGVNDKGETIFFPKSLKQTSINLQWYELLEYDLPPISEKDVEYYIKRPRYKGITIAQLNTIINKWDRYMIEEWIEPTIHYNLNDVFIVCEMIRLYMDEIKLRYNISRTYEIDVLSSSRSNIADKMFIKFYSEFSGLQESQWRGKKTERTTMSFRKVIFPVVEFKTKILQDLLEDMKKVNVHSTGKDSFKREVTINKLTYTIATGGLHSQDIPRELRSKIVYDDSFTGDFQTNIWDCITDDSYIYVHYDIASFYPSLMVNYDIAPAHINEGVFVKLVKWLRDTRVKAKHSEEDIIDGIPKEVLAQVLKIVINSIYGKLGKIFNAQLKPL